MTKATTRNQDEFNLESSFINFFEQLPDPRVVGRCRHSLVDIVVISICALLCGAESWVDIEQFGNEKKNWLKKFLSLQNGIPSHDTFARVFSLLKPEAFETLFFQWARGIAENLTPVDSTHHDERLCIDGKSISGTAGVFNGGAAHHALHLVSVYSFSNGLVLGQHKAKSSGSAESEAVLECLESLNIRGALISVDAANSQRKLMQYIRTEKAHYVIPLKSSAKKYLLKQLEFHRPRCTDHAIEQEHSHGREEKRECRIYKPVKFDEQFKQSWQDVQTVIELTRTRKAPEPIYNIRKDAPDPSHVLRESVETMFYISSKKLSASQAIARIREHWSIENQLHWSLDVAFGEDDWKVRNKKAAQTLALVRKIAFNLVKSSPSPGSMRIKIKRAGWNQNFLETLMFKPTF